MSGGSYNYMCFKDGSELFGFESELQGMADRLAALGYATDAAKATYKALETIRKYKAYLDVVAEELHGVWHAVEWWDSGDSGEMSLASELMRYRGLDVKEVCDHTWQGKSAFNQYANLCEICGVRTPPEEQAH
jgi:hypothetical protein